MVCKCLHAKNVCKSAAANDYEKMILIILDDVSEISFPINMSFSSVKKWKYVHLSFEVNNLNLSN